MSVVMGTVVRVTRRELGDATDGDVLADATSLPLEFAGDFDSGGGVALIGDTTEVVYTAVADESLVLSDPLVAAVPDSTPVRSMIEGQVEEEWTVAVDMGDGGDPRTCQLDTSLIGDLREGEEDAGKPVRVEVSVGRNRVIGIVDQPRMFDGSVIDPDTIVFPPTAVQTFSVDPPSSIDYPEGHGWWQVVNGEVSGFWRLASGVWTKLEVVTADALRAQNALIVALEAEGVNADWVTAGTINVDRLSIGSAPVSVLPNSNMEDAFLDPVTGVEDPSKFAGWETGQVTGGIGGSIDAETVDPISGTRSLRVTLAGSADGQRVESRQVIPVAPGAVWTVSVKARISRAVDKAASGEQLLGLMFHTSDGTVAPTSAANDSTVVWQVVESVDAAVGDVTLSGTALVPAGHTLMQVTLHAGASLDGAGYVVVFDEVHAVQALTQFQVVDPDTGEVSASITQRGNAQFRDLAYTGTLQVEPGSVQYGAETLWERFERLPAGRIGYGSRTFAAPLTASNTKVGLYSVDVAVRGGTARSVTLVRHGDVEGSVAGLTYQFSVHYTYDATLTPAAPTVNDPVLVSWFHPTDSVVADRTASPGDSWPGSLAAGNWRFLLSVRKFGGTTSNYVSAVGVHAFSVDDAGPAAPDAAYWGTDAGGSAGTPDAASYTATWSATDTHWFSGAGAWKGGGEGQFFGNTEGDSAGRRKAAIWFNKSAIVAALAGATVTKVELYMYMHNGGTNSVGIGKHTDTTPGNQPTYGSVDGANRQLQTVNNWDQDTGRWVDITFDLQGWAQAGGIAGFVIGPETSDAESWAGGFRGAVHSLRPKVRITYTK